MTRARGNGQGSIDFYRGRWRVRVLVEGARRTLGRFDSEERAQGILAAWIKNREAGEVEAPSETTLDSFAIEWLDLREIDGSDLRAEVKDVASERSVYRRHVEPSALARMPLDTITTRDVETFARWLRRRPKVHAIRKKTGTELRETGQTISRQTQKHALRIVGGILESARKRGMIDANPAEGVRVAPDAGRARDLSDDWLRADEIDRLLACEAIPAVDRRVYAVALGLALRLRDLQSIEVAHVRLDVEIPGPHVVVAVAKKGAGAKPHRVPILPWLEPIIREQLACLRPGSRWLFPTREGLRYHKHHDFRWAEKRETGRPTIPSALELAGVERRVRFHDLRGTTATHLALGTWGRAWSLHEIQSMLAHSDQRVTERYVRRALDMLAEAARGTAAGPGWSGRSAGNLTNPGGLEPPTYGSGDPGASQPSRAVTYHGDQRRTSAIRAAAVALIEAPSADTVEAYVRALEESSAELAERARAIRAGRSLAARLAIADAADALALPDDAAAPGRPATH